MKTVPFRSALPPLLALAACLCGARAEGQEAKTERILLATGALREGRILAVAEAGVHVLLDGEIVELPVEDLDPVFRVRMRLRRFDRGAPPTIRQRYELAQDCLGWGLLAEGRSQLERLRGEHKELDPVVDIWLRDFPVMPADEDLRRGVGALLDGVDEEAYAFLQKAGEAARETPTGERARHYLEILIRSGYAPPEPEGSPPLDRALKLRLRQLQSMVPQARQDVETAKAYRQQNRSVTKMRDALDRGEKTLTNVLADVDLIMSLELEARGRAIFLDFARVVRQELLTLHLEAGELYLGRGNWSDAQRSVGKALDLDRANVRARALNDRLPPAHRVAVD